MDWKRRKVARGEYEIGTSSAREAKAIARAVLGSTQSAPRIPKTDQRDEAARLVAEFHRKRQSKA